MSNIDQFLEPESKSLSIKKLLERINESEWLLFLPSFQRSFAWDSEDVKKFLESIINGYPVGFILLWEPSEQDVDPFRRSFIDSEPDKKPSKIYYILDGQQRLTALMLLAKGWKIKRGNKEISVLPLSFDPSKKDLELYKGTKKGIDLYRGIRAFFYHEISEKDKLQKELGEGGYERFSKFIERKILDYEIPVHIIRTSKESPSILSKMANIFIMVNRAGQRITNVELLLSYAAGVFDPEITNLIRQYYDQIQSKYGEEVNIQPFLRFAFSKPVVGLTQQEIENVKRFKKRIVELSSQLTNYLNEKKELHEKVQKAFTSFSLMLDLVVDLFGAYIICLLPSYLSLIPIACYLYANNIDDLKELTADDRENIKKWLILVNFNGYYTAKPSIRLEKDIETIMKTKGKFPFKDLREDNIKKYKPLATKILIEDIREGCNKDILKRPNMAYLFLLYIALVENNATDFSGKLLKTLKGEDLAKHHIFSRKLFREQYNIPEEISEEEYPVKGINGLGNVTLINASVNSEISSDIPKDYLPKYSEENIEKHFIPLEKELWDPENFDVFTVKRVELICNFLKVRYQEIID